MHGRTRNPVKGGGRGGWSAIARLRTLCNIEGRVSIKVGIHYLATGGSELPALVPGLPVACLVSPVPPEGTSNPRPVSGGASRGARGLKAYGLDAERSLGAEGRSAGAHGREG